MVDKVSHYSKIKQNAFIYDAEEEMKLDGSCYEKKILMTVLDRTEEGKQRTKEEIEDALRR